MKTLILINIVSSNNIYRLNSYIEANKKKLCKPYVFFCAVTEKNRKWSLHEKISFNYKILPNSKIEMWGKDLFTYFINYSIWKELNELNPDRIIICGWYQFSYQVAYLWAFINRKKITLWSESTVNEKSIGRVLTIPIVRLLVKLSDDFIACGKRSKEYLISLGAKKKNITIFMDDVNKEHFIKEGKKWRAKRVQIKKKFGIKKRRNFIYVGQLIERKGVANLLLAFKNFEYFNPNWGLVIVGYGKQEQELKELVQKLEIKNVNFLGNIEQYSLPKIYTACDCLVLPSSEEVWGLVVNEALYSGLKVIVSDKCGCVPDLVKEGINGYSFKVNGNSDLLAKMKKISLQYK